MIHILVIDDETAITDVLDAFLTDEGYRVLTAGNGREGLECLARQEIDLVLCDIMMPVMDGRAFCRAVRGDARFRHVPLVLMSAMRETLVGDDCTYAAFINKPFDLDRVITTIQQLLSPPLDAAEA
jgi:two-component system alkaline phosphatase synthesis response regulator PhoP